MQGGFYVTPFARLIPRYLSFWCFCQWDLFPIGFFCCIFNWSLQLAIVALTVNNFAEFLILLFCRLFLDTLFCLAVSNLLSTHGYFSVTVPVGSVSFFLWSILFFQESFLLPVTEGLFYTVLCFLAVVGGGQLCALCGASFPLGRGDVSKPLSLSSVS